MTVTNGEILPEDEGYDVDVDEDDDDDIEDDDNSDDDPLDFAIVDEMPVMVRGIDDRTQALAFQAVNDLKPRQGTNTPQRMRKIKAIGRFLKDYGYTVRIRVKDGMVTWRVIEYKKRQLSEEHLAKLRAAGHARKGQKRTRKA